MIMRPNNKRLERDRGSIRSDFAPGNPRPVHPRPTDACAAARGFEICVRAQLQSPARPPVVLLHDVKQPAPPPGAAQHLSFPRRIFCVRVRISFAPDPDEGRAERRQAHGCSGTRRGLPSLRPRASYDTRVRRRGRPGACEAPCVPQRRDARLSALRRGDFRPGTALPSPALPPDPCSELLAARSSCLAGGVPDLPSPRLRAAAAGRHSPLRLQDRL
jgi:hypothetical protein